MVQVLRLIEQKHIGESNQKQHDCHTVEQADHDQDRQQPQDGEMHVHEVARPGLDPAKPIISEVEPGRDEHHPDPVISEILPHIPEHQGTERDAEHR